VNHAHVAGANLRGVELQGAVYDGDFTLHEVQVAPPKSAAKGKAAAKKK